MFRYGGVIALVGRLKSGVIVDVFGERLDLIDLHVFSRQVIRFAELSPALLSTTPVDNAFRENDGDSLHVVDPWLPAPITGDITVLQTMGRNSYRNAAEVPYVISEATSPKTFFVIDAEVTTVALLA